MILPSLGLPLGMVRDLGWALLHFLWQGLVLAALLHMILLRCRSATVRHNWALGTLTAMAVAPVLTLLYLHTHEGVAISPQALAQAGLVGIKTSVQIPNFWIGWVVMLWLAGIAVLSLRALGGWYLTEQLRRRDILVLPVELLQRCHALQRSLSLIWPVQFLLSRRVNTPVVVGWLRPVVLIPVAAMTGLSPSQLDALILHELAHIRRLDAFTNIFLVAVETTLFYHPAVWWVSRRIRIEREHCCDDFAVSICGDAATYVEALTSLEIWKASPTYALAANGGNLRNRAARLLGFRRTHPQGWLPVVSVVALVCIVAAISIAALDVSHCRNSAANLQAEPSLQIEINRSEAQMLKAEQKKSEFQVRYRDLLPNVTNGASRIEQARADVPPITETLNHAIAERDSLQRQLDAQARKAGPTARNIENPIWVELSLRLIEEDTKIAVLRRRLISAETLRDEIEDEARRTPAVGANYVKLEREYDSATKNYVALLARRDAALASEKCRK